MRSRDLGLILTGIVAAATLPGAQALGQSAAREIQAREVLARDVIERTAKEIPLADLSKAQEIDTRLVARPRSGFRLDRVPTRILTMADIGRQAPGRIPSRSSGTEGWSADLIEKWAGQSVVIGEAQGVTAVNLFAPDPASFEASLRNANSRCSEAAGRIATRPGLIARFKETYDQAALTAEELGLVRQFTAQCFKSPFGNPADPKLAEFAARAAVLEIDRANGDPSQIARRGYCSALMIDNTRVATARHCLFRDGSRIGDEHLRILPLNPRLTSLARIHARIDPAYQLPNHVWEWTPNVAEDFVVLQLTEPIPLALTPLGIASEEELGAAREFYQAGYQHLVSLAAQKHPVTLEDMRGAYRLDTSKYCVAIRFTKACLIQGCQSVQRTSGAAFFVRSGTTLKLAGTLYGGSTGTQSEIDTCLGKPISDDIIVNLSSRAR